MRLDFSFACLHLTFLLLFLFISISRHVLAAATAKSPPDDDHASPISVRLWKELEELARLVDIAYCVDTPGIQKPFLCNSHCQDFPHVELVTTWNTGPLFSDSCGYIAVSHPPSTPRIIVAFRGTYSIVDSIVDLSALPQPYVPYPPPSSDDEAHSSWSHTKGHPEQQPLTTTHNDEDEEECPNCTVHAGFLYSWTLTRKIILPYLEDLVEKYPHPEYRLELVGHSLGGAVAALAALEFHGRGWHPVITTFGEPRVGNDALAGYFDDRFALNHTTTTLDHHHHHHDNDTEMRYDYRRVTHTGDPVPLLPPATLGYKSHANEIFVAKRALPPSVADVKYCTGDEDPDCSAGSKVLPWIAKGEEKEDWPRGLGWFLPLPVPVPGQSVLAHRDYFLRLGLCVPGGDPSSELPPWHHHHPQP